MREPAELNIELQQVAVETAAPAAGVHLLFVPDIARPRMLLWGSDVANHPLAVNGESGSLLLPDESFKLRRVRGYFVPLLDAVTQLAAMTQGEIEQSPGSVAVWSLASKLLLELVARERLVPRVIKQAGEQRARWSVVLNLPQDQERFAALVKAFPVAAHAVPHATDASTHNNVVDTRIPPDSDGPSRIWSAEALLREFLDAGADHLVRTACRRQAAISTGNAGVARKRKTVIADDAAMTAWPLRLQRALTTDAAQFVPQGVQERMVLTELRHWTQSVAGTQAQPLRLCLQLHLPEEDHTEFELDFLLQRADDVQARVTASELFVAGQVAAEKLQCDLRVAHEQLLQMLAVAARSFSFIEAELRKPRPDSMRLNPRLAWEFVKHVPALQQAGVLVQLPEILAADAQQRLSMQMCIGDAQVFDRDSELNYHWQATLAGEAVSLEVLHQLIDARTPLARYHDTWVVLDPRELQHALKLFEQEGGTISLPLALSLALTENIHQPDSGLRIQVLPQGALAELVTQMRERETVHEVTVPATFTGSLRPYQRRGMSWLAHLTQLGLGACLADDMGLGKTVQLLAYLLHRQQIENEDTRPMLLVCPTSVVGNWEREIARFAPALNILRHYGVTRIQNAEDFAEQGAGKLVITSYGLMRRDASWLRDVQFAVVVLDEAQFIKNADSATARTARALKSSTRIALTGTPVENHLAELWSIMEFLNPGLLGPHATFRREIAIPVERYGREDVALRLRRMIAPFILRRTKNDPGIATDLPAKQETKVFCSLTREQATLYQQAIDEAFADIETADGITRRGRVLALLTALKQICNHPAHYLREQGPLNGRSGKLDRLCEMLLEVLATQDRALVFTQYREMGERLVRVLSRLQGKPVPFLHGGVARAARDEMVRRFQELPKSSRIMIVSLKAGGTGLNLTAASEVFHFDRWWNPAVEDQATDRAHRIGQHRNVQVYKLLCAGTVEEKIDAMLESKRDLAARVVSGGEAWITELDNQALRELFSLAPNAVVGDAPDADDMDDACEERRAQRAARKAARTNARLRKSLTESLT
ncbi:MAG TPA: DEAD/DEAH box helicase [Steroidobacteraceae bacterium]|nr:DEAD/DEAH box helicase [Steroidobacteraceae bacterium]